MTDGRKELRERERERALCSLGRHHQQNHTRQSGPNPFTSLPVRECKHVYLSWCAAAAARGKPTSSSYLNTLTILTTIWSSLYLWCALMAPRIMSEIKFKHSLFPKAHNLMDSHKILSFFSVVSVAFWFAYPVDVRCVSLMRPFFVWCVFVCWALILHVFVIIHTCGQLTLGDFWCSGLQFSCPLP